MSLDRIKFDVSFPWSLLRDHGKNNYPYIIRKRTNHLIEAYENGADLPENLFYFIQIKIMHHFLESYPEKRRTQYLLPASERVKRKSISDSFNAGEVKAFVEELDLYIKLLVQERFSHPPYNLESRTQASQVLSILTSFDKLLEAGDGASADKIELLAIISCDRLLSPQSNDFQGNTLLHLAAHEGNSNLFKFLIEAGWNINGKNNSGQTAGFYAQKSGIIDDIASLKASNVNSSVCVDFTPDDFHRQKPSHPSGNSEMGTFHPVHSVVDPDATDWALDAPSLGKGREKMEQEVRARPDLVGSDEIILVTREALSQFLSISLPELDELINDGFLKERHIFKIGPLTRYNLTSIIREGFLRGH